MHTKYMTSMHQLIREANREIDAAQVHSRPGRGLMEAWENVMRERDAVTVKMDEEDADDV